MLIDFGYIPSFVIWAGTWMLKIYEIEGTWHIALVIVFLDPGLNFLALLLVIAGPQLVFAYFMYRLYSGKTSTKKAFGVGLLGVMPPILYTLGNLLMLLQYPGYPYFWPYIPIPLSLIIGYFIVKKYPPPRTDPRWLQ